MALCESIMVTIKTVFKLAFAIASIVTITARSVDACERFDFIGRVKRVTVTESLVDPTGKVGEARQSFRIEVSQDGRLVETTIYGAGASDPNSKSTSRFDDAGRLVSQVENADGKTVSTTNCSYDPQGRLIEENTQSSNAELTTLQTYVYGSQTIRLRARVLGRWYVINQTLDDSGRIVKETEVDEERATTKRTSEFVYSANRKEECTVSYPDPRRHCRTTILDAHGNEVEAVAEEETRQIAFEYDSHGNWISKRTVVTRPRSTSKFETVEQRKIEYW
jgi:YD repeat-containing protein